MSITERPSLSQLGDPAVVANPYPVLAEFREASPYALLDGGLIVLGRHADCSRVLRDPRASSERNRSLLAPPDARRQGALSFLSMDPPDHTRLRRLVSQAFTPRVVAGLAPRIREVTGELLAQAAARDPRELELVGQLAYPLPVRIISELLGVPPGDHRRFAAWSARLAHSLPPEFISGGAVNRDDVGAARAEFGAYCRALVARRRAEPGDDLLTLLLPAADEGSRLSEP